MNSSTSSKNPSKDGQITEHQFRDLLTAFAESSRSQRKAAEALGISSSQLNDVLMGRKPISENIARKMGFKRIVIFEPDFEF